MTDVVVSKFFPVIEMVFPTLDLDELTLLISGEPGGGTTVKFLL